MALRIAAGISGVFFLLQGLGWIVDPAAAAAGLGMPLLEGVGRSTQVGDFAAFFLVLGTMIVLGAVRCEPAWLRAGAGMLATAAVMRTLAWLVHDAAFGTQFIVIESAVAALLLFAAQHVRPTVASASS